jgi:glycosyltransferase involved in cell wall biosynthesis
MNSKGVSIIIPTYNGGDIFKQCLNALLAQEYDGNIEIIVIDSGSTDNTVQNAKEAGAEVTVIDSKDFHHSRTRNQAVLLSKYPKVILLVQDAIPIGNKWIEHLSISLDKYDVVAAYGKQVPHKDADLYARFEVDYHSEYLGDEPLVQSIDSIESFKSLSYDAALRNIRFDNVCAIYSKEHLLKYPFPDVPFGEDMAWALEVMKHGYQVLYQPAVKVYHSHNRSPEYRFKRAIVDTIVCADILARIKQDLSFLNYNELMVISDQTTQLIHEMYSEFNNSTHNGRENCACFNAFIKSPIIKKIVWTILRAAKKSSIQKVLSLGIKKTFENHIRFVISLIRDKYPDHTNDELLEVIKQIAASMQGGLFGEVYVSYKVKGGIPSEIEQMIIANSRGV